MGRALILKGATTLTALSARVEIGHYRTKSPAFRFIATAFERRQSRVIYGGRFGDG